MVCSCVEVFPRIHLPSLISIFATPSLRMSDATATGIIALSAIQGLKLQRIALKGRPLARKTLQGLCQALKSNHTVRSLDVSCSAIGSSGGQDIADLLRYNESVAD